MQVASCMESGSAGVAGVPCEWVALICCDKFADVLQYTFLLPASKNLPRQVIDFKTGKTKQRSSVGVRMPKEPIVQVWSCIQHLQRHGHCMAACFSRLLQLYQLLQYVSAFRGLENVGQSSM